MTDPFESLKDLPAENPQMAPGDTNDPFASLKYAPASKPTNAPGNASNPFSSLQLDPVDKKDPHVVQVGLVDQSGPYKIGPPTKPDIKHDNGFLDKFRTREPEMADRLQFAKWVGMLEGSEALCNGPTAKLMPQCHGEDLADANAAYRHFLFGEGKDRTINYERFLQDDASGKMVLPSLINDFELYVSIIGKDRTKFSVTSGVFHVGGSGGIAPYPATSNWQKAIGAHELWVSANVTASCTEGKIYFDADMTIHMEDRYNFNPGAADVATGIPDADNGRFEITGLAKQYTNYGTVTRHIRWADGSPTSSKATGAPTDRQRKPSDNRRLRNKV
jgi:hypothetical protein